MPELPGGTGRVPGRLEGAEDLACRQFVELVTDYFEDALPPAERARFEAHVAACEGCATYLDQMRSKLTMTRAAAGELESRPEVSGLLAAFRDWHRSGTSYAREQRESVSLHERLHSSVPVTSAPVSAQALVGTGSFTP